MKVLFPQISKADERLKEAFQLYVNSKPEDEENLTEGVPLNLAKVLLSVVMLSPLTLGQKVNALYDLYDAADQNKAMLSLIQIKSLVQGMLETSQFFIKNEEIMHLCEYLFGDSVNLVNDAVWTSDSQHKKETKYTIDSPNIDLAQGNVSIREQVQATLYQYF